MSITKENETNAHVVGKKPTSNNIIHNFFKRSVYALTSRRIITLIILISIANGVILVRNYSNMTETTSTLFSCEFEIFGKVQGVFFRKYTTTQAKQLGLHGWCMNTNAGTVKGQMEGPDKAIREMQNWLSHQGSPSSKIERATFTPVTPIKDYNYKSFTIKM